MTAERDYQLMLARVGAGAGEKARDLVLDVAAVSALISVAIERQGAAPGGIDAVAYSVLRGAQRMLGGAAGMVPGERPVTGAAGLLHETPAASAEDGGASS